LEIGGKKSNMKKQSILKRVYFRMKDYLKNKEQLNIVGTKKEKKTTLGN
jgi:hypothetical protein